jgi:hypothetical protein
MKGQILQNERTMIGSRPVTSLLRRLGHCLAPPPVISTLFLTDASPAAAMCAVPDWKHGAGVFGAIILLVIPGVLLCFG